MTGRSLSTLPIECPVKLPSPSRNNSAPKQPASLADRGFLNLFNTLTSTNSHCLPRIWWLCLVTLSALGPFGKGVKLIFNTGSVIPQVPKLTMLHTRSTASLPSFPVSPLPSRFYWLLRNGTLRLTAKPRTEFLHPPWPPTPHPPICDSKWLYIDRVCNQVHKLY